MAAAKDPKTLLRVWDRRDHEGLKLRFLSETWGASTNQAKYWSKLLKEESLVVCRGKRWFLSVDGWLVLQGIDLKKP